ncbi:MAG: TonB-dependent receptor, partial [Bacteroidia bacterium]|nr:TonB-dependent receptor [Bacteroidia bacterium]MDW8334869.1 TonB-dependent receptor [Bacteroidia bacterium]
MSVVRACSPACFKVLGGAVLCFGQTFNVVRVLSLQNKQTTMRFLWIWALAAHAWAQPAKKVVVSGEIKDAETGETLSGVTVRAGASGAVSNAYGFYSLSHPPADSLTITFSLLGYRTVVQRLVGLKENRTLNVAMSAESVEMETVVIEGERIQDLVETTQMGHAKLDATQMQKMPAIFGEVDVVKVLQFLPGIKAGTEGTAGYYVRGGGSDQNLILLDEAVVYNASHLGGLFSVFNSDA